MPLLPGLVLGFSPIHRGEWGRGTPRPFRKEGGTRRRHRVDVKQADRDFSQHPKNHHLDDSKCSTQLAAHQHAPPRSYAILVISPWPPTRDLEYRKWDNKTVGSNIAVEPEGTSSTAISVADRTRQQGHTRPALARPGPNRPTKTPPPRCSKPALMPPPPVCHRTSPPPGSFVATRRPACLPLPR
jgi:hypothetical protein